MGNVCPQSSAQAWPGLRRGSMITKQADRLARERMAVRPFVPAGNADFRLPHAQEYSAFYLGEIAKHLEKIATSAEKMDKTLEAIAGAMRCDGEPRK
jgi:hypothetical protein